MRAELVMILAAVAALSLSHWFAYERGKAVVEAEDSAVVEAMDLQIKVLREEVDRTAKQRQIVYRDRVKVIRDQTDDCMDRLLPVPAAGQLRADDPVPP